MMQQRKRVWLIAGALVASMLLHSFVALSDLLYLWWQSDSLELLAELKKTQRKLQAQTLQTEAALSLRDVQAVDSLSIRFGASGEGSSASSGRTVPAMQQDPDPAQAVALSQPETMPVAVTNPPPDSPPAEPEPPAPVVAAPPPQPMSFPSAVHINYVVKGVVDGDHHWQLEGNRYSITTKASLLGMAYEFVTEGEIGQQGLRPSRFVEYRNHKAEPKYQVDFDWDKRRAMVGEPGSQKEVVLSDGAQDLFSAAYQFALQGDKLASFEMQVISGRNSYQVPFEIKGETELTLSGAKVNTLVLAGVHGKRRFEFYLAPGWHNLPVRIRADDGEKVLDLLANQLDIEGKSVLERRVSRRQRDR